MKLNYLLLLAVAILVSLQYCEGGLGSRISSLFKSKKPTTRKPIVAPTKPKLPSSVSRGHAVTTKPRPPVITTRPALRTTKRTIFATTGSSLRIVTAAHTVAPSRSATFKPSGSAWSPVKTTPRSLPRAPVFPPSRKPSGPTTSPLRSTARPVPRVPIYPTTLKPRYGPATSGPRYPAPPSWPVISTGGSYSNIASGSHSSVGQPGIISTSHTSYARASSSSSHRSLIWLSVGLIAVVALLAVAYYKRNRVMVMTGMTKY